MTGDKDFFDTVFYMIIIVLIFGLFSFPVLQIRDDRIIRRLYEEVPIIIALVEHCCSNDSIREKFETVLD